MESILKETMITVAKTEKIGVCSSSQATVIISLDNKFSLSLPGATYGFCARFSDEERKAIFLEAQQYGTNRISSLSQWLPIRDDIYPLYWGKDISQGERIRRHWKNNSNGTGLVRFCAYSNLKEKEIACVSLTVTEYEKLEFALQYRYKDLLKTSNRKLEKQ